MTRKIVLLLIAALLGITAAGCGGKEDGSAGDSADPAAGAEWVSDPLWSDGESMKAFVISDLHYTENKEADGSVVPGIAMAEEITDALLAQVLEEKPDVFIMTGDNTDSGYDADVSGLVQKLRKVRDAGIPIILTTGNHDFDCMDAAAFEEMYFDLLTPADRDPASLSYTAVIKDVVFLAMDDNAVDPGGPGAFRPETMRWLGEMLEKYGDRTVIFLSHHNVLYGQGEEGAETHLIQNPSLSDVLRGGGVRLALSGHMHFQYILERDGLYEILSGMPFSGNHPIGRLAVGKDRIVYLSEPFRSSLLGSAAADRLQALDEESAAYSEQMFGAILDREKVVGYEYNQIMKLIGRVMGCFREGTIAEHAAEIRQETYYKRMIEVLWNYNYGPWMQSVLEGTKMSAVHLEVPLQDD